MDNYGTHGQPNVKAWLDKHPRFVIHYVPTSCSWLNLIERWFAELTDKAYGAAPFSALTIRSPRLKISWPHGTRTQNHSSGLPR